MKKRKLKFKRHKRSKKWEKGIGHYNDKGKILAITTKGETVLCPPFKVKNI